MKQTITAAIIAILLASCAKQECPKPEPLPEPDKDCTCGRIDYIINESGNTKTIGVKNDCTGNIREYSTELYVTKGQILCILERW